MTEDTTTYTWRIAPETHAAHNLTAWEQVPAQQRKGYATRVELHGRDWFVEIASVNGKDESDELPKSN